MERLQPQGSSRHHYKPGTDTHQILGFFARQVQKSIQLNNILHGPALEQLKTLDSESVDCCITSPPYFGLRDYKVDGQLGLEKNPQEYIQNLMQIFDKVKRILKSSGAAWINMGDSYNGNKSLSLIPERFAIAMVDQGWILRNKIIWYKPNCMPSSAKDRFTVDWEYLFFFTKSQKYYFETQYEPYDLTNPSGWRKQDAIFGGSKAEGYENATYSGNAWSPNPLGRIKRCVWKIPTKPFSEAHFAAFPPGIVYIPLMATCPVNGVVLDPFIGSGTTALVAVNNARNFIGIELNQSYIDMAMERLRPYLLQTRLQLG